MVVDPGDPLIDRRLRHELLGHRLERHNLYIPLLQTLAADVVERSRVFGARKLNADAHFVIDGEHGHHLEDSLSVFRGGILHWRRNEYHPRFGDVRVAQHGRVIQPTIEIIDLLKGDLDRLVVVRHDHENGPEIVGGRCTELRS